MQVAGPLYLQITPSKKPRPDGTYALSRSWIFKFKVGKKRTGMGLGPLSELPLDEALYRARQKQEQVDRNENPIEEEKRARRKLEAAHNRPVAITFREAAEQYAEARDQNQNLRKGSKKRWAKGYKDRWLAVLKRHVYKVAATDEPGCPDVIGDVPVADITREHLLLILKPLGAKAKTAKDVRGRIYDVLAWAMAKRHRPRGYNPATWMKDLDYDLPGYKAANQPALDYTKAGAFMAELRTKKKKWLGAKATEFAILTAARASEVIGMRWGEVDWNARGGPLWTCPAERMKKGREHIVPLSAAAQDILRKIQGDRTPAADEIVFKGAEGQLAENALLKCVQRINPTVTQHGFRSTFSDWRGDRTDFDAEIAEFALAHVKKGVEGVYHRATSIAKRRELMEAWADYLDVIEGENVVTFAKPA
jgi:integrase